MMFLNTGTGATNNGCVWSSDTSVLYFGTSAVWTYETAIKSGGNLSDGTDKYQIICRFSDVSNGGSVDGAYISYTHGTSSGKFEGVTASNSTRSPS